MKKNNMHKIVLLKHLKKIDYSNVSIYINIYIYIHYFSKVFWRCPRGVMVKAMDCGIAVREFVLQWRYYVHFWTNTLGKGMNPLILPAMG